MEWNNPGPPKTKKHSRCVYISVDPIDSLVSDETEEELLSNIYTACLLMCVPVSGVREEVRRPEAPTSDICIGIEWKRRSCFRNVDGNFNKETHEMAATDEGVSNFKKACRYAFMADKQS